MNANRQLDESKQSLAVVELKKRLLSAERPISGLADTELKLKQKEVVEGIEEKETEMEYLTKLIQKSPDQGKGALFQMFRTVEAKLEVEILNKNLMNSKVTFFSYIAFLS